MKEDIVTKKRNAKFFGALLSVAIVFSLASAAFAAENDADFKRFGVRIRALYLIPHQKNNMDSLQLGKVKVQDAVAPELDLEYFFTPYLSAELVLALTKHDIELDKSALGSTWLLPPTLTAKIHPFPKAKVSPYVGAGFNVVMPFNERLINGLKLKLSTSVGFTAQVGVDVPITDSLYFNLDGKYYTTVTDARLYAGSSQLGKYHMRINPFIIGAGLQYRF